MCCALNHIMSALKSGAYPVTLNGEEYGLLFSLNALDAIQDKFGSFDKLDEVFNSSNSSWIKDTKWLLALLINEARLAEDENAELLPEDRVGRMVHAGNLEDIQNAIFAAFARGTVGDEPTEGQEEPEETEEDNKGNSQAVQES